MRIEYIGHACFYFVTNAGTKIIIDPYDDSLGLTSVRKDADIALVSHHHPDHSCLDGVHGDYTLIEGPGEWEQGDVKITGYQVPHDRSGGSDRGMVTAYLIEADGVRILHMSDVGCMPEDSFFDALPRIDILMVPVGGNYTVDAKEAYEICERLRPSTVIPMHYKTTRLRLDIAPVNGFIEAARTGYDVQRQLNVLDAPAGIRKKHERVIVMENSY